MSTKVFKTFITGRQAIAKTFVFAIVIASVASCSARRGTAARTDEGVVINGVRWATRNADGFRTFVASPEMMGGFYAWHSSRARNRYSLRRPTTSSEGWPPNQSWHPCPPGWRLPTMSEFESLIAAGSVWTAVNGVNGRLFGTAPNQLFLPAAGQFFDISPERVRDVNEMGYYLVVEPRAAMIFCQENIGFPPVHGYATEGLTPRQLRDTWPMQSSVSSDGGMDQLLPRQNEGFLRITIFPELSVRCVAVTDDD